MNTIICHAFISIVKHLNTTICHFTIKNSMPVTYCNKYNKNNIFLHNKNNKIISFYILKKSWSRSVNFYKNKN